ncbi:DUF6124 family protein [Pseudomonas sp. LB3P81]
MRKVTPDPPNPDVDDVPFSTADIRATPRTPSTMFSVNPEVDVQELLGFASESLASACVITMDLADRETGSSRNTLLGVVQIVMTAEITVNRALDQLDPID